MWEQGIKLEVTEEGLLHKNNSTNTDVSEDKETLSDPRNMLNGLTAKEWIKLTKSVWFQNGLGKNHADTDIEKEHPAPFSFQDVQKLITMFTKPGMVVLDPFCGVASTLKAAALCNRNAVGIEISYRWVKLGKNRLNLEIPDNIRNKVDLRIIRGDCLKRLPKMRPESIDFIVTSPPYWRILSKRPSHKANERLQRGLATKYSSSPADLSNITDYANFLNKLQDVAKQCFRVLRCRKYVALIVGDFRDGPTFYPFHIHAEKLFEAEGFLPQGIIILAQNSKKLFPYGYPFSFVSNIHHQYILLFQKPTETAEAS